MAKLRIKESEIITYLNYGLNTEQIAQKLKINNQTVEHILADIGYLKLGNYDSKIAKQYKIYEDSGISDFKKLADKFQQETEQYENEVSKLEEKISAIEKETKAKKPSFWKTMKSDLNSYKRKFNSQPKMVKYLLIGGLAFALLSGMYQCNTEKPEIGSVTEQKY